MATSTTSVPLVDGPHPDAAALDARVMELRSRFPRAIIDRYLGLLPDAGRRTCWSARARPWSATSGCRRTSPIWYGAVLRGDLAPVTVGRRSNIQDGAVLHVGDFSPCEVGAETVVGHRVMLHGCRVEDGCIIGMQATILDDAVIGAGSVVGAGALVTAGSRIPPRSLVLGAPARVVRTLGETTRPSTARSPPSTSD